MEERCYIDRDWTYCDAYEETMREQPMSGGEKVTLPHTVVETPLHYFDEGIYQKLSCYQRYIPWEDCFEGKEVYITFEGAAHEATVFLNGQELIRHKSGYTAFTVRLPLERRDDNLLTVRLDSRESLNQPPFGFVIDYMTYGGLYRDVYLSVKDPVHMKDIFLKPTLTDRPDTSRLTKKELHALTLPAILETEMTLSEAAVAAADDRELTVRQFLDGKEISSQPLSGTGKTKTLLKGVHLWDIADPHVYRVRTELLRNGEIIDAEETTIGFREAVFKKDGFYLNGRYVKIRGLDRHQSYPYVGYAMPESMQRYDAFLMKEELGLNAVRTSHYPQSQAFIDECDRRGLLVFTEIPGWQHIGDSDWKDVAVENTKEMVVQYRNHPSIILWGVRINESPDDDEFYQRTNDTAHALDPTRQTGGVRCRKKMSLLEDVYTYNDFVHDGTNAGCEKKADVTPDVEKPYLISEYNGHMFPTKPWDCEEHLLEHTLRHARVLDAVNGQHDIAGAFGWCMFDYNTHKDFGSGDRICYHGVMDMFRNPKGAAAVYAAQANRQNVLYVTSSMEIGEHPASVRGDIYIITNADSVKMYKDDRLVREYFPADSPFKNMKHGPIPVTDLIGDAMMEGEGFSKRQNELVKTCLNETAIHGYTMSAKVKKAAAQLILFYHMNMGEAQKLYEKYIGDWGGKSKAYRFDAIRNGKVVKSVTKTPMTKLSLAAEASADGLYEGHTYDVMEIRVRAVDENGNTLSFMNEPLFIQAEGPVEIIGPHLVSFEGGQTGLYVKSAGISGRAKITLSTPGADEIALGFPVFAGDEAEAPEEAEERTAEETPAAVDAEAEDTAAEAADIETAAGETIQEGE